MNNDSVIEQLTSGIPSGEELGVVMIKVMAATTALTLPPPLMQASVVALIAVIIILGSHFLTKSFVPGNVLSASLFNPH